MLSQLVLLFVLVVVVELSISQNIYYVKPNNSSDDQGLTLDQYITEKDRYFRSGSTFLFLSGNHSLVTQVNLTDVLNVTIRGIANIQSNVICTAKVAFRCKNVTSLNIEGMTFLLHSNQNNPASALAFFNCSKVTISNSVFRGNEDINKTSAWAVFSSTSSIAVSNCLFKGNTGSRGGAIVVQRGSRMILTGNSFTGNQARTSGGALHGSNSIVWARDNFFTNNKADKGGAIYLLVSNATLENINVVGNSKGGVYISDSSVKLNGTNTFVNNFERAITSTCKSIPGHLCSTVTFDGNIAVENNQGALLLEYSNVFFAGNVSISNNYGRHGFAGSAIFSLSSNISFTGYTLFYNNSVSRGGIIDLQHMLGFSVTGSLEFINNNGKGGSIQNLNGKILFHGRSMFINNTAKNGGVISIAYGTLIFTNTATFINNTAVTGGAIETMRGHVIFKGMTTFINNTAKIGGAIYTAYDRISFIGSTIFKNNTAHENGGALYVLGTSVIVKGTVIFTSNSARNGGAMYLTTATTLTLGSGASFISSHNSASEYGGAIYHRDNTVTLVQCNYLDSITGFEQLPFCFLNVERIELFAPTIEVISFYDSANKDGSFIFGGLLDKCRLERSLQIYNSPNEFLYLFNVTSKTNATKAVSSDPFQLHLCSKTNYSIQSRSMTVTVHRGQTFAVPVVALGQGHIITSTVVTAVVSNSARLELSQSVQPLPEYCSDLTYRLYSTQSIEQLILYPDGPCRDTGLARISITVTLLDCPNGFVQHDAECVCEERLQAYDANCTIEGGIHIARKAGSKFWMSTLYKNGSYQGLILYHSCPMEYCKTETTIIPLEDLNKQCDLNRSGVLCGECAANYSLLLGSSQCAICSNSYLFLLLPFAVAGLALVIFLTFLKLTVATGMVNSVILYANFVQVNKRLFFPINTTNILTVFIAWLNLDFGFETCFFAGMDAYMQTWLQFAFPVYVWILISVIILSSRYSITVSKLIGSNPIAVLATLLLMSYTKILKIIIEVYSSIPLDYPNGQKVTVWLKDANLPYLQWKHLFLTVVTSLVLVFIFLPYTFILLLCQRIYRLPNRIYFRWLVKFKPLLDCYNAPYKIGTRYWTGFLLLVRCVLYITFSVIEDSKKNLLAIIFTFTGIAILASGRIYKNLYNDVIESSMYFNLIILSAGILAEVNKAALSYALIGVVLVTTLGIIVYHFHLLYIAKSAAWISIKLKMHSLKKMITKSSTESYPPIAVTPRIVPKEISKTIIELRETLIDN